MVATSTTSSTIAIISDTVIRAGTVSLRTANINITIVINSIITGFIITIIEIILSAVGNNVVIDYTK